MNKKALLALLLVMAMLLSGCALVEKDMAVDRATEIIRVGDRVFTKGEIQDEVDYQLNYTAYLYSMFGMSYDITSEAVIAQAQQAVVDALVEQAVSEAKIAELGLDQLTEEEQAELDANAAATWQSNLDSIQRSYLADTELTGDELTAALEAKAAELGVTYESVVDYEKSVITAEKLYNYVIADVVVTDAELQAAYDEQVEQAKTTYTSSPASYVSAANAGSTVYYRPAGFRQVKQILISFTEEDQAVLDELDSKIADEEALIASYMSSLSALGITDVDALVQQVNVTLEQAAAEDTDPATQTDLAAAVVATVTDISDSFGEEVTEEVAELARLLAESKEKLSFYSAQQKMAEKLAYAAIAPEADDVLAQLADGADWDTLMAEKTDDPGMQGDSVTAQNGYTIYAEQTNFDEAFLTAAMALENVGDVSDKVQGMYGYYIIQYTADVVEGPVALEEVSETLSAELLSDKQDTTYDATVAQWIEAAKPTIDYNALNN
ncbi:MAG: peptidylprolyl isomerase [Aristaeellaceae bacterium]